MEFIIYALAGALPNRHELLDREGEHALTLRMVCKLRGQVPSSDYPAVLQVDDSVAVLRILV